MSDGIVQESSGRIWVILKPEFADFTKCWVSHAQETLVGRLSPAFQPGELCP